MLLDDQMTMPAEAPVQTGEGEAVEKKKKKAAPKRKGKKTRQVSRGCAYIQATYNNTIVTLTDTDGNVLAWSSAGGNGFRGPKKATPYAASVVIRRLVEKVADVGMKEVDVFVKGVGQGRESAVRALNANGLNVLSIKDITPIPHNGCRPPRPRRV
jgi:small subunit ribosomal protein S11